MPQLFLPAKTVAAAEYRQLFPCSRHHRKKSKDTHVLCLRLPGEEIKAINLAIRALKHSIGRSIIITEGQHILDRGRKVRPLVPGLIGRHLLVHRLLGRVDKSQASLALWVISTAP